MFLVKFNVEQFGDEQTMFTEEHCLKVHPADWQDTVTVEVPSFGMVVELLERCPPKTAVRLVTEVGGERFSKLYQFFPDLTETLKGFVLDIASKMRVRTNFTNRPKTVDEYSLTEIEAIYKLLVMRC